MFIQGMGILLLFRDQNIQFLGCYFDNWGDIKWTPRNGIDLTIITIFSNYQ
jgi:hypothetical protein